MVFKFLSKDLRELRHLIVLFPQEEVLFSDLFRIYLNRNLLFLLLSAHLLL